jgi:hypothetical protein
MYVILVLSNENLATFEWEDLLMLLKNTQKASQLHEEWAIRDCSTIFVLTDPVRRACFHPQTLVALETIPCFMG